MNFRSIAVLCAISLFTACPQNNVVPIGDGGTGDGGPNPMPIDNCSGGCSENQICDQVRRTCVSGCADGCVDGGVCIKVAAGQFQCAPPPVITCNSVVCDPGEVACLGGECSCLASAQASNDSCAPYGKWCRNGDCVAPDQYEECKIGGTACVQTKGGQPTGYTCKQVFSEIALCTKTCTTNNECSRGEFCSQQGCLPSGLFGDQDCSQNIVLADGGLEIIDGGARMITVPVANTCLLKSDTGVVTDAPGKGAGNCTYALFRLFDQGIYPFTTCQPPGAATEGQPCRFDLSQTAQGTQCSTGLECALVRGTTDGVCMRTCNANPPKFGIESQPACGSDERCVNLYRYTDPDNNSVLGVCMKSCSVFDATKNACGNVGTVAASCVATDPNGQLAVSTDGTGVCIPQRTTVAAAGAQCDQIDPFRGAACASGQLCASASINDKSSCIQLCDTSCNPSDGGTGPTRCATQPNAHCGAGKTCKRTTSTTGATVGFCL